MAEADLIWDLWYSYGKVFEIAKFQLNDDFHIRYCLLRSVAISIKGKKNCFSFHQIFI